MSLRILSSASCLLEWLGLNIHIIIQMSIVLRALKNLNKFRLHGKQITLAWAPGKGMKEKQWKEFWDLDSGASFIPIEKLDPQVNCAGIEIDPL